jgi:hypothetical protein
MNTVKGSEIAARQDSQYALRMGVRIANNKKMMEELRRQLKDKSGDAAQAEKAADGPDMDSSSVRDRGVVGTAAATLTYDTDGTESFASSYGSDFDDDDEGDRSEQGGEEVVDAGEGVEDTQNVGKEDEALAKGLAESDMASKPLEGPLE